ncbi:MAG: DUF2914 domain-containing protein [Deferribacteraceae bacterium]|jgi:hypothetical protein|nr:DUF2914 domain-containing protein [Deferribacteraceae bacterium]
MKYLVLSLFVIVTLAACNTDKPANTVTSEVADNATIEAVAPAGEVTRYTFADGIVDKEPVWTAVGGESIIFFTELAGLSGQTAHHIWQKNGENVYNYETAVGGDRWRTYSSMKLAHFKAGDVLQVSVTDGEGTVLAQSSIAIAAEPEPEMAVEAEHAIYDADEDLYDISCEQCVLLLVPEEAQYLSNYSEADQALVAAGAEWYNTNALKYIEARDIKLIYVEGGFSQKRIRFNGGDIYEYDIESTGSYIDWWRFVLYKEGFEPTNCSPIDLEGEYELFFNGAG